MKRNFSVIAIFLLILLLGCSSKANSLPSIVSEGQTSGTRKVEFQDLEYNCKVGQQSCNSGTCHELTNRGFKFSDTAGAIIKLIIKSDQPRPEWQDIWKNPNDPNSHETIPRIWQVKVDTISPNGSIVFSNSGKFGSVGFKYSCETCYYVVDGYFIAAPFSPGGKIKVSVTTPTGEQAERTIEMPTETDCNQTRDVRIG